jgi:uncharacterized protein
MNLNNNILKQVKIRVQGIDPNAKIFLFGSRARNDEKVDSDWDFLILTEKQVTQEFKNNICDLLFEEELDSDQILTAIIQNIDIWKNYSFSPIYKNIMKDSIEL